MTTTPPDAADHGRMVRTAMALIGLPVFCAAAVVGAGLALRDNLPDPIGIHWGTRGVDGFAPFMTDLWISTAMTLAGGVLMGVILGAVATKQAPWFRRPSAGLAGGMAAFLATTSIGGWWIQPGLADARDAPDVGGVLVAATLAGLAFGALGAWVMPGQVRGEATAAGAVPAEALRVDLPVGQRAAWAGWSISPAMVVVALVTAVVPPVVMGALGGFGWPLVPIFLLAGLVIAAMAAFRVVVGAHGVRVQSVLGWPRFAVPLTEVAEASVIEVKPLAEFGGWGIRGNFRGQFGVIQRAGEALQVRRGDGSSFVVTIDGAAGPAALLNTLADRSR